MAEDACPQCVETGDTGHEIIQSYEPGEGWRYCYLDDVMLPPAKRLT